MIKRIVGLCISVRMKSQHGQVGQNGMNLSIRKASGFSASSTKKLVENGLIILKDSQKENASWLTEQDISMNIGLPLNSNLIMEAFGECLLKKSTNFVKVDVNNPTMKPS